VQGDTHTNTIVISKNSPQKNSLLLFPVLCVAGVKNVFQAKDMKYVNVSVPWLPNHHAMIPQLVETQMNTEKVISGPRLYETVGHCPPRRPVTAL